LIVNFCQYILTPETNSIKKCQNDNGFKNISNFLLNDIIEKFLSVGTPPKIILFGSRATGKSHSESDYDFLVIEESLEKRYKRAAKYRRALQIFPFAKDIVVWTPEEVMLWENVPQAFITTALREGTVLYERK